MGRGIHIHIDQGELLPIEPDVVQRGDVGPGGARGLWDGFGKTLIDVNGQLVMVIQVRENKLGEVVVRAIVPEDIPSGYHSSRDGEFVEANLERAGLIEPDSTSRDHGWIIEQEGQGDG